MLKIVIQCCDVHASVYKVYNLSPVTVNNHYPYGFFPPLHRAAVSSRKIRVLMSLGSRLLIVDLVTHKFHQPVNTGEIVKLLRV